MSAEDGRVAAIRRYLETGESDPTHPEWSGSVFERCGHAKRDLVAALIAEVHRRSRGCRPPADLPAIDLHGLVRAKVAPMVRGLFPARERDAVLALLTGSVIFVTPDSIETVLRECGWLSTTWDLANLYLASLGADLLADDAPGIVGLSEESRCYVSLEYFSTGDRFSDFIVHETAHMFHNNKRRAAGLPETRTREWLLDIEFRKRETFAYACEAYGRFLELSTRPAERRMLLGELQHPPADDRVDEGEYRDILEEAVVARNGWKRILARCSPR